MPNGTFVRIKSHRVYAHSQLAPWEIVHPIVCSQSIARSRSNGLGLHTYLRVCSPYRQGWLRPLERVDGWATDLPVLFDYLVLAMGAAFGGGFVAQAEVVLLDFVGIPFVRSSAAEGFDEEIVIALGAEAEPFGLGGSENEIGFEAGMGAVGCAPVVEEVEPVLFRFVGEDEGLGAGAVFGRVLRTSSAAFRRRGAGAAAVAFFGWRFLCCGEHDSEVMLIRGQVRWTENWR